MSFAPDSQRLVVATVGNTNVHGGTQAYQVTVWNARTGEMLRRLTDGDEQLWSTSVSWLRNGRIALGTRLWDADAATVVAELKDAAGELWQPFTTWAMVSAGPLLAVADRDVKLFSADTGAAICTLEPPESNFPVQALAISPDHLRLAAATGSKDVCIWDLSGIDLTAGAAPAWTHRLEGLDANALAFSPDGRTLACAASYKPKLTFWSAETGQPLDADLPPHRMADSALDMTFSPNGQWLLYGCQNLGFAAHLLPWKQ